MTGVAVRIGALDLDEAEIARFAALLDDEERARAARFRFDRDRRRFVVRRGRLREWLGACTGERPERLAFAIGPFGKPVLEGGPHFSLSHSHERTMLAIADAEVGCDIEWIDTEVDWRPLAEGLFAPAERDALAALPDDIGRLAFFRCWARKEAFVKAIGEGLSYPLDAFTVSIEPEPALLTGGEDWTMAAAPDLPGYAGAIVARADSSPLEIRLL
jgi:4'-phosphopantetheinyl transferase